jgi:branched-chain amino acid transport system ATP-binding protein
LVNPGLMVMSMPQILLEVEGVDVYYGDLQALRGVSFTVRAGEVVTLIGANGAGKSTTLRAISGIVPHRVGRIRFDGISLDSLRCYKIARMGVAHVPEGRRIFPLLTVHENVLLGACTDEAKAKLRASTLDFIYQLFPRLKERRNQLAGTLSGGEQQMLAIGRALAMSPRLLMLDEPSLGLAPHLVRSIFDTLRTINEQGVTILLVEQNVHQALRLADRAYVLENGSVVLHGTAEEVAAHGYVRTAYLGV